MIRFRNRMLCTLPVVMLGWTLLPSPAQAQFTQRGPKLGGVLAAPVETVLHSFTGGSDGAGPRAGLIADESGALYGTTESGGSSSCSGSGCGTVFKLKPPPDGQTVWTETVLYSFTGVPPDGAFPQAGLIADESAALYGTTPSTVFKLTPPPDGQTAWTETVLHSFTGGSDGAGPRAGLIADESGALYGTTESGGSSSCSGSGCGTVFKLKPPPDGQTAWTETVLYRFTGGSDGSGPVASLTAPVRAGESQEAAGENRKDRQEDGTKGVLYGTTFAGGTGTCPFASTCGTVFKLTLCPEPKTWDWHKDGRDDDHGGCPVFESK